MKPQTQILVVLSCFSITGCNKQVVSPELTRRQIEHKQPEIQVDAGSSIEVDYDAPIRELNKVVQSNHKNTNFRVKWRSSVFQDFSEGVALYERRKGTLREYIYEGNPEVGVGKSNFIYSNVTDGALEKLAKHAARKSGQLSKSGGVLNFYFEDLTKYGCIKKGISTP